METAQLVKEILTTALTGAVVDVQDMTGTRDHFEIFISAPQFQGKKIFEQHRMVMGLLKDVLAGPVHAVKLNTKALDEVLGQND